MRNPQQVKSPGIKNNEVGRGSSKISGFLLNGKSPLMRNAPRIAPQHPSTRESKWIEPIG